MCTAAHDPLDWGDKRYKEGATWDRKKDKPEVVCALPHMALRIEKDRGGECPVLWVQAGGGDEVLVASWNTTIIVERKWKFKFNSTRMNFWFGKIKKVLFHFRISEIS